MDSAFEPELFRLFRQKKMPRPMASRPATAAPTPIPALAPVDKVFVLWDGVLLGAVAAVALAAVSKEGAVDCDEVDEVGDADCDDLELDDVALLAIADVDEPEASVDWVVEFAIDELGDGVAKYCVACTLP